MESVSQGITTLLGACLHPDTFGWNVEEEEKVHGWISISKTCWKWETRM
jgi:hypothetical protein